MSTTEFMAKVVKWEDAWANYVDALDSWESADHWHGDGWVSSCGRLGGNLRDAENRLRALDPAFCKTMGI